MEGGGIWLGALNGLMVFLELINPSFIVNL